MPSSQHQCNKSNQIHRVGVQSGQAPDNFLKIYLEVNNFLKNAMKGGKKIQQVAASQQIIVVVTTKTTHNLVEIKEKQQATAEENERIELELSGTTVQ